MQTIFSDPAAHDVTRIQAEVLTIGPACLRLTLSGRSPFVGDRKGDIEIYGPIAMAPQFQAIADAINATFAPKPADLPVVRVDPINESPSYRAAMTDAGRGRLLR